MTTDDEKPFELTEPEFEPDDEGLFERDVSLLLSAAQIYLDRQDINSRAQLIACMEDVRAWYEDGDPRSMGWVDNQGRP